MPKLYSDPNYSWVTPFIHNQIRTAAGTDDFLVHRVQRARDYT